MTGLQTDILQIFDAGGPPEGRTTVGLLVTGEDYISHVRASQYKCDHSSDYDVLNDKCQTLHGIGALDLPQARPVPPERTLTSLKYPNLAASAAEISATNVTETLAAVTTEFCGNATTMQPPFYPLLISRLIRQNFTSFPLSC